MKKYAPPILLSQSASALVIDIFEICGSEFFEVSNFVFRTLMILLKIYSQSLSIVRLEVTPFSFLIRS